MDATTAALIAKLNQKFHHAISDLFDISANELYPGLKDKGTFSIDEKNLTLNAATSIANQFPAYEFSSGIVLAINDALMALLSNDSFYTEIALPSHSIATQAVGTQHNFVDYRFANEFLFRLSGEKALFPKTTNDKERLSLGNSLFERTGQILLLNQTAHFLNGHIQYVKNRYQRDKFEEISDAATRSLEELADYRAMSLDADNYAIFLLINQLVQIDSGKTYNTQSVNPIIFNEHSLREISISFMLHFSLWDKMENSETTPESGRSHLNAHSRFLNFLQRLQEIYEQNTGIDLHDRHPLIRQMVTDAQIVFSTIHKCALTDISSISDLENHCSQQLDDCKQQHEQLTPRLFQYARQACNMMGTESIYNGFG